jgi:hypothetical protein
MIVPPYIKRRVVEIDNHLTIFLSLHTKYYLLKQHKELYLETVSLHLCQLFIQTYDYRSDAGTTEYYKKVKELIPVIKYLIRTKVVSHWEQMNEVKE